MPFLNWKVLEDNIKKREINPEFIPTEELLDIIHDIYKEKQGFDKFCKENKESRKSMGQFLFLYFRDKYNSNNEAIQKAYNFINSMFINSSTLEVSMFMSILQHQIEEEYFGIFHYIKCTLEDSVLGSFHREEAQKSMSLAELLAESGGLVPAEVAKEALLRLYPADHPFTEKLNKDMAEAIKEAKKKKDLKDSMKPKKRFVGKKNKSKKEDEEEPKFIYYSDLENLILKFELNNHRIFLSYLRSEFRKVDLEKFGLIPRKQFLAFARGIFKKIDKKLEAKRLFEKIKGYDTDMIIFSDVVRMFSKKKIKHQGEFMNLIEILNASLAEKTDS